MEDQGWDESKASAMKLGRDVAVIASRGTREFLEKKLFNRPPVKEQFARDMHGHDGKTLEQCAQQFETFSEAFLGGNRAHFKK